MSPDTPPKGPAGESPRLWRKIGIASAIMMASIFLSRVMGLIREMVIAGVAGADTAVDAYRVAFVVPEILNHILASGFLSVTFIPIFSGYLAEKRDDEGWHVKLPVSTVETARTREDLARRNAQIGEHFDQAGVDGLVQEFSPRSQLMSAAHNQALGQLGVVDNGPVFY